MTDKEKLRVIKHSLEETYKDSRHYMNSFYKCCENGEIDDLEEVVDDGRFDEFINNQPIEYIRIYDYALLELSRRLLKTINDE